MKMKQLHLFPATWGSERPMNGATVLAALFVLYLEQKLC
jgi:hypothetical protein